MRTIAQLAKAIQHEAERADIPIDRDAYERNGKEPTAPILFAGNLDAPVAILGRDLGKDEVAVGQPLVGAGGRLVRAGLLEWENGEPPPKSDRKVESALDLALLTNTVPYKPPGNKAYPERIKARFRPFVAELLVDHWKGDHVLTLGTEAFQWFAPYADPEELAALWARDDRYESAELACEITVEIGGKTRKKQVRVAPLPHPSPLNQRWYGVFPELILRRLRAVRS
ncbi:MAG TPA: uracil-DNA glycosylase family protein [Isosphaeraceae bacterium]|jgi:uracil-DNA glycosylase